MRIYDIALLAATALLACAHCAATGSTMAAANSLGTIQMFAKYPGSAVPERLLRTEKSNENDEERAGLETFANLVKSKVSIFVDSAQLQIWALSRKTGVQILNKLQLGDNAVATLKNPKLKILTDYIEMFNKNLKKKLSLLGTLTARYGDFDLAKALLTAKLTESTKIIATELQTRQSASWVNRKKSIQDVFTMFKISDAGFKSIGNWRLDMLSEYIKVFNSRLSNPKDKTNLFRELREGFGGEAKFAIVVARAVQQPATNNMLMTASSYQTLLFDGWIVRNIKPANLVKKIFKADESTLAAGSWEKIIAEKYKTFYNKV